MVTKEQLIECIKEATVKLQVTVPARGHLAAPGDIDDEIIEYVDATRLIAALQDLS